MQDVVSQIRNLAFGARDRVQIQSLHIQRKEKGIHTGFLNMSKALIMNSTERPGIRLWRRYPHSAPDKRACRSSSGVCEPDSASPTVRRTVSNWGFAPPKTKNRPRGSRLKPGIRLWRRYPHSAPDKRACRSSSGVCEPDSAPPMVCRTVSNWGFAPPKTKNRPRGSVFVFGGAGRI